MYPYPSNWYLLRYHSDAGEMSLLQPHQFCCTPSPKGQPGQCCYRRCSGPVYGTEGNINKNCFVATLTKWNKSPLNGLYLCQQCYESSKLFQELFPHPLPITELPMVDTSLRTTSTASTRPTSAIRLLW